MAPRKESFCQAAEINVMLDIILKSPDINLLMRSTHLPTRQTYIKIAQQMAALGYARSRDSIRSKFKSIKANFLYSLETWGGNPQESRQTPHHHKMMRIWTRAGKPHWSQRHHFSRSLFL